MNVDGIAAAIQVKKVRVGANDICSILDPEYGIAQAFFCYTVAILAVDRVLINRDI
jgi:hypothetical protein